MNEKILDLKPKKLEDLLNAALKEFSTKGFQEASTNVIAKNAKMSKSLMFHYVNTKQELFLFVYNYFSDILDKEYFLKMDFSNKDIFERLRQSYQLQIVLIERYPSILDFEQLSIETNSDKIDTTIKEKPCNKHALYINRIFDNIDESKFRNNLDIEKCKQFILWCNTGFTNQILDSIKESESIIMDKNRIKTTIDAYIEELANIFYKPDIK